MAHEFRDAQLLGALAARPPSARSRAPHVVHAQTATLKITTWGGKWGEVMKGQVMPAFEKEFKCKVEADQAFPYCRSCRRAPKNAPLYDVLHTNSNEQWQRRDRRAGGRAKITAKEVPNIADVYPYAVSDKIVGVCDLHQRDRARLPHRQGAAGAEIVEGPRRSEARRRSAAATSSRSTASARCT